MKKAGTSRKSFAVARPDALAGLHTRAARTLAALVLALCLPALACAYTIVLRGGRRVEIPQNFAVTILTLTYEAAPGINVTLLMSSIDVAATERANNEPAGSLLRRVRRQAQQPRDAVNQTPAPSEPTARQGGAARRTLTNKELEGARRTRERREAESERRRVELGLPSLEESRRRRDEEAQRVRAELQESMREEAQSEAYWRERAAALRAEIAALDAEINYLRARLAELPDNALTPSYTVITSVVPLAPLRPNFFPHAPYRTGYFPRAVAGVGPGIYTTPGATLTGRVAFGGGATRGQVLLNAGRSPGFYGGQAVYGRRGFHGPGVYPPIVYGGGVYGPTIFPPAYSTVYSTSGAGDYLGYERASLVARWRELEAQRAGLGARFRVLEDEARRAGALPGWLRP